jgi:hypothetical protein
MEETKEPPKHCSLIFFTCEKVGRKDKNCELCGFYITDEEDLKLDNLKKDEQ